jgi:hypothetical protein
LRERERAHRILGDYAKSCNSAIVQQCNEPQPLRQAATTHNDGNNCSSHNNCNKCNASDRCSRRIAPRAVTVQLQPQPPLQPATTHNGCNNCNCNHRDKLRQRRRRLAPRAVTVQTATTATSCNKLQQTATTTPPHRTSRDSRGTCFARPDTT